MATVIYGAGHAGTQIFNNLPNEVKAEVFFVDDDKKKHKSKILDRKIFSFDYLEECIENESIKNLIFAIPSQEEILYPKLKKLVFGKPINLYKLPKEALGLEREVNFYDLQEIQLENFIDREQFIPEETDLNNLIEGKTFLITGGCGTIGSELVRIIARYKPKAIIVADISEIGIYNLSQELSQLNFIKYCLCDVCSISDLKEVTNNQNIDYVFHCAALKHVNIVEKNIIKGFKTNVLGTLNVLNNCIENKIKNFTLISTDKAVRSTNIMGATKRLAEKLIKTYAIKSDDLIFKDNNFSVKVSAVRFGNVWGSSGSVIPKFIEQINKELPITVTDKKVERYFMSIKEACNLVLCSCKFNSNGEIYVLDMGKPVKIVNIAKNLIKKYSKNPTEMHIKFTGLKKGEKLYEELSYQKKTKTENSKIFKDDYFKYNKSFSESLIKMIKLKSFNEQLEEASKIIANHADSESY
jgi:UDP-N-acetyl-D-glucosamine 4,6-dehydratase